MIILQNISYSHANKDLLFSNISLTVNTHDKVAIIGNNGTGKSTLLHILARKLEPASGQLTVSPKTYLVPQIFGQYDHLSVAQALGIDKKLSALHEILDGNVTEDNLNILDDDWNLQERCQEALEYWQLDNIGLSQMMDTLSGGQKTKVFLAGISVHQPELILMDEPSNHLDKVARQLLYDLIRDIKRTLVVVSHDRKLLNLLTTVIELNNQGIRIYGGNYDFYTEQKLLENNALNHDIHSKERALRKAREKQRDTMERQQKLDSRAKGKKQKAGTARIMMNTLRNTAENSSSKLKNAHAEKIGDITSELQQLRSEIPEIGTMRFGFDSTTLRRGKKLLKAVDINFSYAGKFLWEKNLNIEITSGERIALEGKNGSGKTTLIKIILGELPPTKGEIEKNDATTLYIDQDYSLLDNTMEVYQQAQSFNTSGLQEHDVKMRLNRFLFGEKYWDKPCVSLSGGERMRLILCCLTISSKAPDIIILDEPTNNLDISNIEIITAAVNDYHGTLIVVSHDQIFLEQIGVERHIRLE